MLKRITERFTPTQYLTEWLLAAVGVFGLYLIIGRFGYTPLDSSWATAGFQTQTLNKAGSLAAWVIDFFLVFFGYAGNLFPFVLCAVPLYLLKNRAVRRLTLPWAALRFGGFVLLLGGTTLMTALLISNNAYYTSGGVLGSVLAVQLYPYLGKFGCIFVGFLLAATGFVLCSGASFIHLLVRFYGWLTMKNAATEPQQADYSPDELEKIVIPKPTMPPSLAELAAMTEQEAVADMSPNAAYQTTQTAPSRIGENTGESAGDGIADNATSSPIHITGLPTVSLEPNPAPLQPQADSQAMPATAFGGSTPSSSPQAFDRFDVEADPLPTISIAAQAEPLAAGSAVDFSPVFAAQDYDLPNGMTMPTVSLSPTEAVPPRNTLPDQPIQPIESDDVGQPDLAYQFELMEQQRQAEMVQRAKALNAEDTLHVILNEPTELLETETAEAVLNVALPSAETDTPSKMPYRPYGDSLIHPAFQKQATAREKPTTPLPSLDLLEHRPTHVQEITREEIMETSRRIEQQLLNFRVKASVKDVVIGPVVTRYELELQPGIKASSVSGIDKDLARALMFHSIRIAEVIPGKPYIGIETPNAHRQTVPLRDVLDSDEFRQSQSPLSMALGKDIGGKPVVVDLAKMPHLLVAGSTGSGKSVGVNTMILSLLFRVKPDQVKFIMIDPKVVELSVYNGIPHLLTEVVTDMKKAANALRWCVDEMERRYKLLSALMVRNIEGFNAKIDEYNARGMPIPNPIWKPGDTMDDLPPPLEKLSYIVVIVDEFADLMMVAGKQIEELIARLAQKARAIGIHLILATQRPSVDVITGLIKANIPSRVAFTVASKTDSRTILDQNGAEALLGRGDMLYSGAGTSDLVRVHGAFMSDDEVVKVAEDWRARGKPHYIDGILDNADEDENADGDPNFDSGELDALFDDVTEFVLSTGITSASGIQRKFRVGYNRAARIMDQLEEQGIVSPMQNGKREVLARRTEY